MKSISLLFLATLFASCTTIHFRSNNTIPVSFAGNPAHRQEISVSGDRDFYFWGLSPEHHEVFLDEEVRKAGFDGVSKVVVYEQKNAQQTLISFLTFGLYIPRGFTITGFSSGATIPEELEDTAPPSQNSSQTNQ